MLAEIDCKDNTNNYKLFFLENFSRVNKCQTTESQEYKNRKRKLLI